MNTREIFQRLGLPKHASEVYKTIQRKAPLNPSEICRITKLHRPTVYRALSELLQRRFIYQTERGNRKAYQAASEKLVVQAFSRDTSLVSQAMAEQIVSDDQYKQKELRFLSGFKGVRAAFDDVIAHSKRGEIFYRYTSEKSLDAVNRYLSRDYRDRRDQKKLERMVISNPISGSKKKPRLERFIKFIPSKASLFDQNIVQLIYGNRVSIINLNTERVVIIENKELADFQKVIFRQLYDKLPLPESHLPKNPTRIQRVSMPAK